MSSYLYEVWEDMKTERTTNASTLKRKCGRCAKIGHAINSCPLNYETTIQHAESAANKDCFR